LNQLQYFKITSTLNLKQMKLFSLLVLAALFSAFSSYAQNTFPAAGNAGIGTTPPAANLHIVGTDADNVHTTNGDRSIVQGNTGARPASTGSTIGAYDSGKYRR
jgi:hypothetical protein